MGKVIFWGSVVALAYASFGYYLALSALALVSRKRDIMPEDSISPAVTIVVPAHNEERVIARRIRNLLELDYPRESLEIIVASDGSTDGTVRNAKQFAGRGVAVLEFEKNRGRADVHNDLAKIARGDILVFTDADTSFERDFVRGIVRPFSIAAVGCVVGWLVYESTSTNISEAEALYYNRWELGLKEAESKLGVLANGSGACMAIRKELFRPLTPVDDVDTATVIDVILQGYKVVFAKNAVAHDVPPKSVSGELRYRARATSKTILSLVRRIGFNEWVRNPVLVWSVFSHRGIRYFTPVLMIAMLVANFFLLRHGVVYKISLLTQTLFYTLVVVGWAGECARRRIPVASVAFVFGVAMLGVILGVSRVITNRVPSAYIMDD